MEGKKINDGKVERKRKFKLFSSEEKMGGKEK